MSDESEWTTIDGAQERCRVLLDAKNRWMDRAVAAEAVLDAERARADAAEDALLNGPDAAWYARLVKVTERAEKAEAALAAERALLAEISDACWLSDKSLGRIAREVIAARKGGE